MRDYVMIVGVMMLLVCWSGACPVIQSHKGSFLVAGDDNQCTYILNGVPIDRALIRSVRGYGLLQTSCKDCSMNTLSKFEGCDDCFICSHNEGVERCRSIVVPILLLTLCGLLSIIVIGIAFCMLDCNQSLSNLLITIWLRWVVKRRAIKKQKKTEKLEAIIIKKLNSRTTLESQPSLYPTLPGPATFQVEESAPKSRRPSVSSTDSVFKGAIALGLLASLGLQGVKSCDDILFLSSTGNLYTDKKLSQVSVGLAFLHTDHNLCFQHPSGKVEELTLTSMVTVDSYGISYKTCDFSLEVKSHLTCKGAGLCWDAVNCNSKSRLQAVGPKAYVLPEDQVGCRLVPNLSEQTCYHKQICIWYYWDIIPKMDSCDNIYSFLSTTTVVHFTFKDIEGNLIPFTLDLDNPSVTHPLIAHLGFVNKDHRVTPTSVRQHKDIFLGVNAAKLHEGFAGLLGDLQLPIYKDSPDDVNWTYPKHDIHCLPDGPSVSCKSPVPGYKYSLISDSKNVLDGTLDPNGRIFKRTSPDRGSVSIMFRSAIIDSQIIETALCGFSVESTYGCTSCPELPKVYIKAHHIEKTGVIPFESNCSFYLPELSCSGQVQSLQLTHRPDICEIKVRGMNQSLIVNLNYEFLGQLYSRGVLTYQAEESFGDKLKLAFSSENFTSLVKYPLMGGFALVSIMQILKMIIRFKAFRAGEEEAKAQG